jgi:hypothetical protein
MNVPDFGGWGAFTKKSAFFANTSGRSCIIFIDERRLTRSGREW